LNELEEKFKQEKISVVDVHQNIKMIFSKYTLRQLAFLKKELNWRTSNVDAFIAAMLLGAIHGGSEGYFSVQMPNTFSMSPNYVRKYIKEHKLEKPRRDVFDILKNKKLDRCWQRPKTKGKAHNHNVKKMTKVGDNSVDLIITSPPYTRVIRYGQFNWIRLWFLGRTGKEVDKKLFFTQSTEKYCTFMTSALKEMQRVMKDNAKAVLVIGDVKDREKEDIVNLAEVVWKRCAEPLGFKMAENIIEDVISDDTKVTKIWGDKKGNATKIDRILVLSK
jgi:site-specific DNA-methyltransferase (adenine-specific)